MHSPSSTVGGTTGGGGGWPSHTLLLSCLFQTNERAPVHSSTFAAFATKTLDHQPSITDDQSREELTLMIMNDLQRQVPNQQTAWADKTRVDAIRKNLQQNHERHGNRTPSSPHAPLHHSTFKQMKDLDTSSGSWTSCSSSHEVWEELSTGSSSELDSDTWSNQSVSSVDLRTSNNNNSSSSSSSSVNQPASTDDKCAQIHHDAWHPKNVWFMKAAQRGSLPPPPPPIPSEVTAPQQMSTTIGSWKIMPEQNQPDQPTSKSVGNTSFNSNKIVPKSEHELALLQKITSPSGHRVRGGSFTPRVQPLVTPINLGPPSEYDFRNTNGLMKCLNSIAQLPTSEELTAKHLVINEMQRLLDVWLQETFPRQDNSRTATATLLLGGSWHLKVGMFDSDLDIVSLLPRFVTPEVFFGSLYEFLRVTPGVTKLVAMKKAVVPILAFQLNGVRIDLLFSRYTDDVVPKNLSVHSDHILAGMDATSIRSLSVPRVASLILELVPNGCVFRSCLRIIRLWAKRRGLYSNKAGFLGGISWTILVAFVCQMFPKATISCLIHQFFTVLSAWQWPTPILISKPYDVEGVNSCVQWCPQQNHHDRSHLMPIITPGFPAVNSAVNVNMSTLKILQEEFGRGKNIIDDMKNKGLSSPAVWQKLFTPSEFLVRYDHYLVVKLEAKNDEELSEWANFVGSRTRKLVETLQHTSPITHVHPFPEVMRSSIENNHQQTSTTSVAGYYLIGYGVDQTQQVCNAASPTKNDVARTCATSAVRYFVATELMNSLEKKESMHVEINSLIWQELPQELFPNGRAFAAGERARYILSAAHSTHVALAKGR